MVLESLMESYMSTETSAYIRNRALHSALPGAAATTAPPPIRLVPDAVAAVRVHGSRIRSNHVKDPSRGVQLHRESRVLRIRALVVRPDERPARRAALQLDRPPVAAAASGGYALGEHVLRQELLPPDVVRVVVLAA